MVLRFIDSAGDIHSVPREWQTATVLVDWVRPELWMDARAFIQGEPLPLRLQMFQGTAKVVADWERAAAGTWKIRVTSGYESIDHTFFIEPAKISRAEVEVLVDDLEERLPPSIALRLARCGASVGLSWKPPSGGAATVAHEIEQVRRAVEGAPRSAGLVDVLHRLASNPHPVFVTEQRWVRTETARRPVPSRLAAALTRSEAPLDGGLPARVLDSWVRFTADTAENRLVREFYDQVSRRIRVLEAYSLVSKTFGDANRATVQSLRKKLVSARRNASFLDDVGSFGAAANRVSQVLLGNPIYAAALEGFTRLRMSARVRLNLPVMDAPLENIPALYEAWCSLTVVDGILDSAASQGWSIDTQTLVSLTNTGPYISILPPATECLTLSRGLSRAKLTIKPRYCHGDKDLHSISYTQIPDLALLVENHSSRPQLHLFDPKYKLASEENGNYTKSPLKVDIDKMHAYRDAIRAGDGNHVVASAAVMFPGNDTIIADGLIAVSARPGTPSPLLQKHICGIFT